MKKVLVVGDWVVDEHWIASPQRSATSSRTGRDHYRCMQHPDSAVESLCGAGRTASILYQTITTMLEGKAPIDVYGIGIWHRSDTAVIQQMLNPKNHLGATPHRLSRRRPHGDLPTKLINLADFLASSGSRLVPPHGFGTVHIIRVYQRSGSEFDLLQRIDWEVEATQQDTGGAWFDLMDSIGHEELEQFTGELPDVDAVVIKDLCKGVVSNGTIDWLKAKYTNAEWFISSKAWRPSWLSLLRGLEVRLLLIPQIAANKAIDSGQISRWLTKSGSPTKAALQELNALSDELGTSNRCPCIIVLPDETSALTRAAGSDAGCGVTGYIQNEVSSDRLKQGTPMASVFFATTIAQLLCSSTTDLGSVAQASFEFTNKWRSFETMRIESPDVWKPQDEPRFTISPTEPARSTIKISKINWQQAMSEWDQAFDPTRIGVIHSCSGGKVLQLWRSTTIVDGYVSIADSKIAELRRLTSSISRALYRPLHRHTSALVVDRPGSGKNHLIECLAKMFNIAMAPTINIVDMNSRMDILDCFDSIVIAQSMAGNKPILVFVDEINATVDGQYVYDSFLRPLEEGYYFRAQKPFKIDPCIWIFAGSDRPNRSEDSAGSTFKVSDFESRLTERCFDFRKIVDSEHERRLEQVYLGAILLTRANVDVRAVSEKVLRSFSLMPNGTVVRDLRHFIERLEYIKNGEVLSSNFVDGAAADWLDEESLADWSQLDEGDLVEIEP